MSVYKLNYTDIQIFVNKCRIIAILKDYLTLTKTVEPVMIVSFVNIVACVIIVIPVNIATIAIFVSPANPVFTVN